MRCATSLVVPRKVTTSPRLARGRAIGIASAPIA
jgi:hypothetical protein